MYCYVSFFYSRDMHVRCANRQTHPSIDALVPLIDVPDTS